MTAQTSIQSPADSTALAAAVADEAWDRADELLAAMPASLPPEALVPAAAVHMHHRRWDKALRLLNRVIERDAACELHRRLCKNMVALQRHRPDIFDRVSRAADTARFHIAVARTGGLTVIHQTPRGRTVLSADNDPGTSIREAMSKVQTDYEAGHAIAVCGLADGYLLSHLARRPPPLNLQQQQAVHLIEPDAELVRSVLMIHDYTAPDGPIAQARFGWYIGDDWAEQFARALLDDPFLPPPATIVHQSTQAQQIQAGMEVIRERYEAQDNERQSQVEEYYEQLDRDELTVIFGDNPPRPPRALMVTTRFSTVLQHVAGDTAEAFEQHGWETQTLIEPALHHRMCPAAARQALMQFKPDLIFQIDHLRSEWNETFPPALPFVCWIQDHLPNLIKHEAGRSIGQRDFVLTSVPQMYAGQYAYPARQCIATVKLTRVPQRPAHWQSDGADLVYVSRASRPGSKIAEELVELYEQRSPARRLLEECCTRLIGMYERGESMSTPWEVGCFVDAVQVETGCHLTDAETRSRLILQLYHPLNDALYRQQALGWVKQAADELELSLEIYGDGWERHEQFAAHARGPVAYGADLEELTRRARINLQIIPSFCLHQRLLDGLVAGGFFLIRRHPSDTLLQELADFLHVRGAGDAESIEAARDLIDTADHDAFDALLDRCRCLSELGQPIDIVQWVQCCCQAGAIVPGREVLPNLDDVSFDDAAGVRQCIEQFTNGHEQRAAIAEAQRRSIEDRLSYTAGIARVLRRIASLINQET